MSIGVVCSLCVCLSIFLLFGSVVCLMTFVNCLLNCVVFCLFVMAVVLLKVIVVLGFGLGFLFVRCAIVLQSMCVLYLWSHVESSKCCFQISVLWFCIWVSMSLLRFGSVGSLGFCCLMLFLWVIRSLMFCGRSLCLLCCFPFGMWCLSAVSMMFVSIVFA